MQGSLAKALFSAAMFVISVSGCSSGNLDHVKQRAEARWLEYGMEPIAYEGYQWGFWGLNDYGGAKVWHRLRSIPDNGITYTGYIQRWGDELHIYGPFAIDAIRPTP